MATHIVTGVAGFIGSNLAEKLLEQGDQVIGIDQFNDYYDPSLKRQNAHILAKYPEFKLIEADIQALDWRQLLQGVEVLFHQAAQAGVRASWGDGFRQYTERNINATQIILEAAKETPSLQRMVFASTSSVYGNAETMPTPETLCPQPVSPYGITKLAAERLCWLYHQNFNVPVTAFVVPEAVGEVFNIGGGSRVVLLDVLDTMEKVIGKPIKRSHQGLARGDARHTAADVTKARTILGYNPQVSLAEGLAQEWQWIQGLYC